MGSGMGEGSGSAGARIQKFGNRRSTIMPFRCRSFEEGSWQLICGKCEGGLQPPASGVYRKLHIQRCPHLCGGVVLPCGGGGGAGGVLLFGLEGCPGLTGIVDPGVVAPSVEPLGGAVPGVVDPGVEPLGLVVPGVVLFGVVAPGVVLPGGVVPVEPFGVVPRLDGVPGAV